MNWALDGLREIASLLQLALGDLNRILFLVIGLFSAFMMPGFHAVIVFAAIATVFHILAEMLLPISARSGRVITEWPDLMTGDFWIDAAYLFFLYGVFIAIANQLKGLIFGGRD